MVIETRVQASHSSVVDGLTRGSGKSRYEFRYRPDIDALRGVAVLAVLLYHVNETWLPGGFVGVDIFFVISGYVVSGSIIKHSGEGLKGQLASFYLRRIKRLMPNLLVMVALTSVAVALLIPPSETRGMLTAAVKSLYGWSNNYFAFNSSDYFSLDSNLNPFSHTWSLGVEEQFYLFYPIVFMALLAFFGAGMLLFGMTLLSVISILLSWQLSSQEPMLAFFLTPSRFWELNAGGLLLLVQRRWGLNLNGASFVRLLSGIVLMVSLWRTSAESLFPVPGVLPVVLATLLLLLPFRGDRDLSSPADQQLTPWAMLNRQLVFIGLLSYSLYLWHWPVVVLMRWTVGLDRPVLYLCAISASFAIALIAYNFIERPLRQVRVSGLYQISFAGLGVVACWLGIDQLAHSIRGNWFLGSRSAFVPENERFVPLPGCVVEAWQPYDSQSAPDFSRCGKPSGAGKPEIFLVGDSHAHVYQPMVQKVADVGGYGLSYAFKPSCLVSPNLTLRYKKKLYTPCTGFSDGELKRAATRLTPGDFVLVANWFNHYLADIDVKGDPVRVFAMQGGLQLSSQLELRAAYISGMRRVAQRFSEQGINLILAVDVPMLRREPVACEAWSSWASQVNRAVLCSPDKEITFAKQAQQRLVFQEIARGLDNVFIFDPSPYLLENGKVMHRSKGDVLRYFDSNHLTIAGSQEVAPLFLDFLDSNQFLTRYPR